jgi:hypothetical protein
MAVFKPELHRLEDVIDYYENSPATHYKIFAGTSPKAEYCRFYFDEDEKEIGLQKLAEALRAIQQNVDNTNPYILQLIEKKKVAKGKENDNLTQIVFQLNKAERYLPMMSGMQQQPNDNFNRLMEKMIEGQNLIISKLSADEFGEDMEEQKPKGFGAILENEQFQQLAIGALGLIINKFAAPSLTGAATVTALAGISDNQKDKALQAIEILSSKDANYGDHLLYLANIDNSTYQMLLGFMK